jgi:hypothetical protein
MHLFSDPLARGQGKAWREGMKVATWRKALAGMAASLTVGCGVLDRHDASKAAEGRPHATASKAPTQPADDARAAAEPAASPSSTPPPAAHVPCVAPAGVDNDPQSIAAVVTLLNALPKPVTLVCYLEALRRPLSVNATSSDLSIQPALGADSPRLFLFSGSLVSAVATAVGPSLLEMSVLLGTQQSVKGEIAFPVTETLTEAGVYARIKRSDAAGTRCGGCHFGESPAQGVGNGEAYASKALRPFDADDVPISILAHAADLCEGTSNARCDLLRAVFEHGDVAPRSFPHDMPTMF